MGELRRDEEWARQMMQAELGSPVVQHDDGSQPAMHDLTIELGDGTPAAVEITAAVDGESVALWKLINDGDGRWQVSSLRGGWLVAVTPNARAKAILRQLPALLGTMEERGATVLDLRRRREAGTDLEETARGIGVTHARQSATSYPGSIYLTVDLPSQRVGGLVPTTGRALSDWLVAFLASPQRADVRAKLMRSDADQRHAFILVPGFTPAPFAVVDLLMRDDAPLPLVAPDLPAEVTHVWAASTWSTGHGVRWSPGAGWKTFSKAV